LYAQVLSQTNQDGRFEYNPYNVYGKCYQPPIVTSDGEQIKYSKHSFDPLDLEEGHIPPCSDAVGLYSYLRNDEFKKVKTIYLYNLGNSYCRIESTMG